MDSFLSEMPCFTDFFWVGDIGLGESASNYGGSMSIGLLLN
jgi:hypothetical protein